MRRLLVSWALLCLLTTPALAHGKDQPDPPKEPAPPDVRVDPRLPEIGFAWWVMDGPRRVSGPYYALRECQRAILRTRLQCVLFRD